MGLEYQDRLTFVTLVFFVVVLEGLGAGAVWIVPCVLVNGPESVVTILHFNPVAKAAWRIGISEAYTCLFSQRIFKKLSCQEHFESNLIYIF